MSVKNSIFKKLANSISRFQNDEKGVIAVIVAISFVGLLLAILALSIDLNRTQTSYSKNYGATDASALGTAEWWLKGKVTQVGVSNNPLGWQPSQGEFEEFAFTLLRENYRMDHENAQLLDDTFEIDVNKREVASSRNQGERALLHTVQVTACTRVGTPVALAAERTDETRTCTTSTAAFEIGKLENTEVAFALDFTESMFWEGIEEGCFADNDWQGRTSNCPTLSATKADNLVGTIDYVFDTYFDNGTNSSAFASIIPYTSFVNLYPYSKTMIAADTGTADNTSRFDWDIEADVGNAYYGKGNNIYARSVNTHNIQWDNNGDFSKYLYQNDNPSYSFTDNRQFTPYYTDQQNRSLENLTFNSLVENSSGSIEINGKNYKSLGSYHEATKTNDYSYILDRVPVIENRTKLLYITDPDTSDTSSILPFKNYGDHVRSLKGENTVYNPTLNYWYNLSSDPDESYRRSECYNGMIAGAADQRIEKEYSTNVRGELIASEVYGRAGRVNELHESYPIQPLTNEYGVLKQVVGRLTADTFLYNNTKNLFDLSRVMDRQRSRLNRASDVSHTMDTSSFHGLMWAWLTLDNDFQGEWDAKSTTETFCDDSQAQLETFSGGTCSGDGGSSKSTRTSESLPSDSNFKNIILIADGFDNDGLTAKGTKATNNVGAEQGYYNACDSYSPVERIDYDEYIELCNKIKDEDINIHIILYDFDPAGTDLLDEDNGKNRYADCASEGSYFANVRPTGNSGSIGNTIKDALDKILLGVITNLVEVKLIDNEDA